MREDIVPLSGKNTQCNMVAEKRTTGNDPTVDTVEDSSQTKKSKLADSDKTSSVRPQGGRGKQT